MAPQEPSARERLGRFGVWFSAPDSLPIAELVATAAEIEGLGYRALWIGEGPTGREAFSHAAVLLAGTDRIVVATGIANIWARDARATYAAAQTLGEAFPGRFVLGLGVSHAPLVEVRGHPYRRPLLAMRSYLDELEKAASEYGGPHAEPPIPVVLAALQQKMIALGRVRADGVHPYLVTPEHTAATRAALGPAPLLAPEVTVLIEQDAASARKQARSFLKGYLGLPNYTRSMTAMGFDSTDFDDGASDRLVDALVAWGEVGVVWQQLRAHLEAGADHVAIQPLGRTFDDRLEQLRALSASALQED